ncbi:hypothetical protein ACIRPX_36465, partial [Streptomyces sp. NPDC101225]|uniref:hypothetical protein n=1 Tax=Streptomyces sp. NPDC101225 TaxID=3366135 RepID=UPI003825B602
MADGATLVTAIDERVLPPCPPPACRLPEHLVDGGYASAQVGGVRNRPRGGSGGWNGLLLWGVGGGIVVCGSAGVEEEWP